MESLETSRVEEWAESQQGSGTAAPICGSNGVQAVGDVFGLIVTVWRGGGGGGGGGGGSVTPESRDRNERLDRGFSLRQPITVLKDESFHIQIGEAFRCRGLHGGVAQLLDACCSEPQHLCSVTEESRGQIALRLINSFGRVPTWELAPGLRSMPHALLTLREIGRI
ncbi:hypothetical protein EYF80_038504 [Liparis tanakae]|uniref:Uncharacterized protein n=1 Tax=Liparis tanakae TaxID=230148 RepID=A0A4Z2GCI5_9TELE|nr:hypothetical protein EYF80_038504 [Liparis tanakae]